MRDLFLSTATAATDALHDDHVAHAWDQPSALPGMTVGGLVAHTARAVLTVDHYLAAPPPPAGATPVDAAGYLLTALPDTARQSEVNQRVLARAEEGGATGLVTVAATLRTALDALHRQLPDVPDDRVVAVLGGLAVTLDDYLATRVLELVVHLDDLAASVEQFTPPGLPPAAARVAVGLLAEAARRRHGTAAMVAALARAERAPAVPPRAF